ncbi:MAG TPA: hypothetical protein VIY47_02175 [Ignavibacteriaceae bacterium]
MRIEVFKTNITNSQQAKCLIAAIRVAFPCYRVNVDLDDCDKILRVVSATEDIQTTCFTEWLKGFGCIAQALPDD